MTAGELSVLTPVSGVKTDTGGVHSKGLVVRNAGGNHVSMASPQEHA